MITKTGLTQVAYFLGSSTAIRFTHIGMGTGTAAPASANTALQTEIYPTTSRTGPSTFITDERIVWKLAVSEADGSTSTYGEHGLFSNSTTGTIFSRQIYPDLIKDGDTKVEDYITLELGSYLP